MSRPAEDVAAATRGEDLLTLARLSVGPDAVRGILDWLGRRTGGTALLVGADGRVLAGTADRPAPGTRLARTVGAAVADLFRRGSEAAVVDTDGPHRMHLLTLGGTGRDRSAAALVARTEERSGCLVVVANPGRPLGDLLADTARTLALCWRVEEADRVRQRIAAADAHGREAVLHLLMVGDVAPARRIASALRPRLPDALRVGVIECGGRQRYEVAAELARSLSGRAWLVPCPVRSNHLIALLPAEPSSAAAPPAALGAGRPAGDGAEAADRLGRLITDRVPASRVGLSEPVALPATASGYEQAVHALAVARTTTGGYARFDRQHDLVPLAGPDGYAWAERLLRPVVDHVPARRADPGAAELLGTLNSWLAFDSAASRHLKIHRNTLAARLRLLNSLLGTDLLRVRDRSAAWLALRLRAAPRPTVPEAGTMPPGSLPGAGEGAPDPAVREIELDQLLAGPAVTGWARALLRPLRTMDRSTGLATVRAWLAADTNLSATSAALGISVSATRKRLVRAEQALGRSLLHAPDARHELWLALRAIDLADG
ncbi:helix-turn-helix domain-containing protein [Plantactinospora sp. WMMB782]|uniref:helix-turn-helix domain-containing protein n=1 Tax=Plantactinospora sp. WMMB782 TaxID=3404121 RepID=UPI003B934112